MDDLIKIGIGVVVTIAMPLMLYGGFVAIRAFQRRLEGQRPGSDVLGELDDIRARVAELERVQDRVGELEERMDFSERMLTREKEPGPLRP
jgi:hypothetical protein